MYTIIFLFSIITTLISPENLLLRLSSAMNTSDEPPPPPQPSIVARSVWAHNLDSEFRIIRDVIDRFPYVSMDTEFPGVVYRQDYRSIDPFDNYQTLKTNVDALKLIQVGITLSDELGNLPDLGTKERFIWEFNLSDFDLVNDEHLPASIDLLRQQGIDFERTRKDGIKCTRFADLMMSSGLVCNDEVTYVTFHGAYDFGYLIKTLTGGRKLPGTLSGFLELLRVFFGERVYDVKHLMKYCRSYLHGGLNRVAATLLLERRVGKSHQSGSDSLLTWDAFKRIRKDYFDGDDENLRKYAGVLFGLDVLSA